MSRADVVAHSNVLKTACAADVSPKISTAEQSDVLLCMYGLPEPPTFNAILMLGQRFRTVTFLRNNLICPLDSYPVIPKFVEIGMPCETRAAERKGYIWKLRRFAQFCWALFKDLRTHHYPLVILHDYLALLAFWIVRRAARYNGLVWFNSYDVLDTKNFAVRRFSLIRLVAAKHESLFSLLDFFSLPAAERKPYYPMHRVKRACFVIPNFPAKKFYEHFSQSKRIGDEIRLIYQGSLGRGHGFEEFINLLRFDISERPLRLILKGWILEDYKSELLERAAKIGVSSKLSFADFASYKSVPELAATSTIGLAIFTGLDIMNQTLGTASNKIYEYAALGLPVILLDTPHFRHHLCERQWAFFTDLTEKSLRETIEAVVVNYEKASNAARSDFCSELNFETVFTPAVDLVVKTLDTLGNAE